MLQMCQNASLFKQNDTFIRLLCNTCITISRSWAYGGITFINVVRQVSGATWHFYQILARSITQIAILVIT
jgi:hypothetical protein